LRSTELEQARRGCVPLKFVAVRAVRIGGVLSVVLFCVCTASAVMTVIRLRFCLADDQYLPLLQGCTYFVMPSQT